VTSPPPAGGAQGSRPSTEARAGERLFGTDGIRDRAGAGRLAPEVVRRVGLAVGGLLRVRRGCGRAPRVLIARDTRESGPAIQAQLADGLGAAGCAVRDGGVLPTPVAAWLARAYDLAAVITASHNPYEDNGIKLIDPSGRKAPDALEAEIERAVLDGAGIGERGGAAVGPGGGAHHPPPHRPGGLTSGSDISSGSADPYLAAVEDRLAGLRAGFPGGRAPVVVLDCAHGATGAVAPALFARLGARVHVLNASPDGRNINAGCGALHPELVARETRALGADLGVAFDGDGDRVILADGGGVVRDGDHLLAFAARHLKAEGRLPGDLVIGTIMTNQGLELSLALAGIRLERVQVGDRFVSQRLDETGAALGGEPSGHVIFKEFAPSGDGLFTALTALRIMAETGRSLAELSACVTRLPQLIRSVRVARKPPLDDLAGAREAVARAERAVAGRGRVNVRYSGTEPVARVMVEAEADGLCERLADDVAGAIREAIGA